MLPKTLALTLFASSLFAAEPDKLIKLRGSYESAVTKATAPIKKTYTVELEKLKIEFTKSGNLEAALAVDTELKTIAASESPASAPSAAQPISRDKIPKDAYRGRDSYLLGVDAGREISWADAKAECDKLGGRMVCITDERKWAEVLEYRSKAKIGRFWAGASRDERDGNWVWADGTPVKPIGVPQDNTNGNPGGLQIDSSKGWHFYPKDRVDTKTSGYICEWPKK